MWALSSLSLHGCRRSWEGLRLVTEQGKQLALNSERIASLYSVEGYRLAPNRYSRASGAITFSSFVAMLMNLFFKSNDMFPSFDQESFVKRGLSFYIK